MRKYDYTFLKRDIPGNIVGLTDVITDLIADKLPDVSIKTIELVLGKMVKENKIVKIGTYKDARYMRSR